MHLSAPVPELITILLPLAWLLRRSFFQVWPSSLPSLLPFISRLIGPIANSPAAAAFANSDSDVGRRVV